MLAVALAIGAGHAFLPGHGKTLMGAYLVGTKGRPVDAFLLGAIVSLMHTASVLALGLVLFRVNESISLERIYPSLTVVSGLLAAAFGMFLLVTRSRRIRRARRDHVAGHDHLHDHEHDHDRRARAGAGAGRGGRRRPRPPAPRPRPRPRARARRRGRAAEPAPRAAVRSQPRRRPLAHPRAAPGRAAVLAPRDRDARDLGWPGAVALRRPRGRVGVLARAGGPRPVADRRVLARSGRAPSPRSGSASCSAAGSSSATGVAPSRVLPVVGAMAMVLLGLALAARGYLAG